MEIKILCACGTKFKFDVEPVEGRSPGPVQCPSCGKDGTDAANAAIQEKLAAVAPAPPPNAGGPQVSIPAMRVPAPAMKVSAPASSPAPAPVSATPPSAAPATASGSPNAPGSPKMAYMPVPGEGGKSLSVAGHTKPQSTPASEAAPAAAPPPIPAVHPAAGRLARSQPPPKPKLTGKQRLVQVVAWIVGAAIGWKAWDVFSGR